MNRKRERDLDVDIPDLVTLGSVALEPLWLFHRADLHVERIPDLAGMTVATEGRGTASDYVARMLIEGGGFPRDDQGAPGRKNGGDGV